MSYTVSLEQLKVDADVLARTLWAEARSLGGAGMARVANVVMNRVAKPGWWTREKGDGVPDDTVQAACLEPNQFSCHLPNDVNYPKLMAVTADDPYFAIAQALALQAIMGQLPDTTGGATNYHTIRQPKLGVSWPPSWSFKMTKTVEDPTPMGHVFYR